MAGPPKERQPRVKKLIKISGSEGVFFISDKIIDSVYLLSFNLPCSKTLCIIYYNVIRDKYSKRDKVYSNYSRAIRIWDGGMIE